MPASAHSTAYRGLSSISTEAPISLRAPASQQDITATPPEQGRHGNTATGTLAEQQTWRKTRLQISDFALDWPSSAQWLPKCTSANTPGKCRLIHSSVGPRMQCCREVTTTRSHVAARRCRL